MNHRQFDLITDLLRMADPVRSAVRDIMVDGAFVIHGAAEWEVVVGHNDHHRRPGKLFLKIGQVVSFYAISTTGAAQSDERLFQ